MQGVPPGDGKAGVRGQRFGFTEKARRAPRFAKQRQRFTTEDTEFTEGSAEDLARILGDCSAWVVAERTARVEESVDVMRRTVELRTAPPYDFAQAERYLLRSPSAVLERID